MTIRPPGRVTRTTSLATANGFGANIAPNMDKLLHGAFEEQLRHRAIHHHRLCAAHGARGVTCVVRDAGGAGTGAAIASQAPTWNDRGAW